MPGSTHESVSVDPQMMAEIDSHRLEISQRPLSPWFGGLDLVANSHRERARVRAAVSLDYALRPLSS